MSNELRETLVIALELVVFAILILIISFFGSYARNALYLKGIQDETITDIVEYSNIYNFTLGSEVTVENLKDRNIIRVNNGNDVLEMGLMDEGLAGGFANGTVITGNDIVNFYGRFGNDYNGVVKFSNGTVLDSSDFNVNNLGEISLKLGEKVNSDFYCFAVYDDYKYEYKFIIFYEKTV